MFCVSRFAHRPSTSSPRRIAVSLGLLCAAALLLPAQPARATNKDIIELQTEVQQLQSMLLTIQQSQEEHMGMLTNMLQQSNASVAKMAAQVDAMQKSMQSVQESSSGKIDQISGQMQSLNDSIDEFRARLDKVQKALDALQQQQQSLQAGQATNGGVPAAQDGSNPGGSSPAAPQAPPLDQLYQSALGDYNAAKYNLASQEFGDVIKFYPQNDLAGNALFYQAEIAYRQGSYQNAIEGYSSLLLQYPGNAKAPAAMLRQGQCLLALGKRDAAIHQFHALIQRYPKSPEAVQAHSKLDAIAAHTPQPKPQAGHNF